eukprot:60740-Hanusia_phi.AAC.1
MTSSSSSSSSSTSSTTISSSSSKEVGKGSDLTMCREFELEMKNNANKTLCDDWSSDEQLRGFHPKSGMRMKGRGRGQAR